MIRGMRALPTSRQEAVRCRRLRFAILALLVVLSWGPAASGGAADQGDWEDLPPVLQARRLSGAGATTTWYVPSQKAVTARLERILCRSRLLANRLKRVVYHSVAWAEMTAGSEAGQFKIALSRSALADIDRQAFIDTHLLGQKRLQDRHMPGRFISGNPTPRHHFGRIFYVHKAIAPSRFKGPCPPGTVPTGADDGAGGSRVGPSLDPQVQLVQLGFGRIGRGIGQQAGRFLGFGKGDHVADEALPAQQHHQAIEAKGDPAVGRGAGFQGRQQEAEFFLIGLGRPSPGRQRPAPAGPAGGYGCCRRRSPSR
jgi:hypothetical protein